MAKKILFSPVGGTDPISMNNIYDGSLLHICRYYKPDVVYLYMSKEVLENHNNDNRYIFCLDELSKMQNRKMEYRIIKREKLENVQRFDFIYNDMLDIIRDISEKMDSDDILYLNVSSGTPAMKSALLVINVLGEYQFKSIQVATPIKKMNEHTHDGYDVKTLWELDEDNTNNYNRCEEIDCPALVKQKKIEIIKKHIMEYDYEAALNVAMSIKDNDADYLKMIRLAKYRLALDFKNADIADREIDINFFPIKSGDERKYFEYMLSLMIKQKKAQLADFLRAITPLILDLFSLILLNECKVDIYNFTYVDNKSKGIKWDKVKLMKSRPDINNILLSKYSNFKYSYILSDHLKTILVALVPNNIKLIELSEKIRNVEESIRNIAAHQIVSIDEEFIKNKTGFNSIEIVNMLKNAFKYTKINIKKEYWDSYEKMNDEIIRELG